MERVSQRESVMFHYAAESPSSSTSSTSMPRRRINSDDVDFNDVFGGPPRRFSAQTSQGAEDDAAAAMSIRSFSSEKPVFGEECSVNRSKYHQSNDFFDDIYGGGDRFCTTPGREFVTSLPASRIMSPSRPLPPKFMEPFGPALPALSRFLHSFSTYTDTYLFVIIGFGSKLISFWYLIYFV